MLIIFTGNGKGKTTAALGQAMRAIGNGSRVLMVQFIKGPWESGEHRSAMKLAPELKIVRKGKGFVGICNDKFPLEVHIKAAFQALSYARKQAESKKWNIIILDEIWNAISLQLVSPESVINFIDYVLPHVNHLIMTGRDCPQYFINRADLVTVMKETKHPFKEGVFGVRGVEY